MTSSRSSVVSSFTERRLVSFFHFKRPKQMDVAPSEVDTFNWYEVDSHTLRDIGMEGEGAFTAMRFH